MRKRLPVYLILGSLLVSMLSIWQAGCINKNGSKSGVSKKDGGSLVIYSGRKKELIDPVIKAFEKETTIKVKLLDGDASQLSNQIIEEGNNPRADIYISNDAGALGHLADKGYLQNYRSQAVKAVPANFRANDDTWVGASIRSRVIMYNTNLVNKDELPESVFDLANPKWKGQFAILSSSSEAMVSNVSAWRMLKGDSFTEDFLKRLMANKPVVLEKHGEIREAVGGGELKLGLVNHYYYHIQKDEGSPVGVIYTDQGSNDIGTILNVAGLGIVKNAKNIQAAQKFVDFVLSPKAQEIFAGENKELPVIETVPIVDARPLSDFKTADIKLGDLSRELDKTMDLLQKVGL